MKKQWALLLAAVLSVVASGATAQTHESITVQVVDVPVYVFSQGKPIRNLTKNDFELYVNGKRQSIDYFDPIEFAPPAAADWGKDISITAAPATDKVIRQKVALPPGNYVAKSLLRVGKSIGFAKVAFTIPDEK